MPTFAELFNTVRSNATGQCDFRSCKTALFRAATNKLSKFKPLEVGSTNASPIQVLDFFSGAGGMSLGFAAVNYISPTFRFLAGCDIDAISAATYSKNFGTPTSCNDILAIAKTPASIREFLKQHLYDDAKPTILLGCAPCQGFSSHRKKHWDSQDDERNNLVIAFSRIVAEINPDVFVMENVPEFLSNRYWKYFSKACQMFSKAGYTVKQNVYNAAEFGVPQARFRSIVVGMKKEFLLPQGHYTAKEYKTVRTAIGGLPPLMSGGSDPSDTLHKAIAHKDSTIAVIKKVPHDGGNLPEGEGPQCLKNIKGFYDVYGRLSWDKPAITITHYARNPASGRYTHPVQDRGLTAREAARLQSFPDGFLFTGKSDDIYRQIGEAVPPLFSCGIAVDVLIEYLSSAPTTVQLDADAEKTNLPVTNSYSNVMRYINNARRKK